MRKWANLTNTGELSIEKVLIQLDIPLLFVCVDKSDERYLVMCIDEEELEYLFVRVDESELIQFISTGCGLREIFTKAGKKIRRVVLTKSLDDVVVAKSKITVDMLPKKNVRYDFSYKDNAVYIGKLNSILLFKPSMGGVVLIQGSRNANKALFAKGICKKRVNLAKDNARNSRELKDKKRFS